MSLPKGTTGTVCTPSKKQNYNIVIIILLLFEKLHMQLTGSKILLNLPNLSITQASCCGTNFIT